MEVSYGVPFGKKSKKVTRVGDVITVNDDYAPAPLQVQCEQQSQHPHVKYSYPEPDTMATEEKSTYQTQVVKRKINNPLYEMISSTTYEDLPHPSNLKHRRKNLHELKPSKKARQCMERQLYVDNHLKQVRHKNKQYMRDKLNMMESQNAEQESLSFQQQTEDIDSTSPLYASVQKTPCSADSSWSELSSHLQLTKPEVFKTTGKPRHLALVPGSVFMGSASRQQQEEESWFREFWKPRIKENTIEE